MIRRLLDTLAVGLPWGVLLEEVHVRYPGRLPGDGPRA
jgi:hypothetical protein